MINLFSRWANNLSIFHFSFIVKFAVGDVTNLFEFTLVVVFQSGPFAVPEWGLAGRQVKPKLH